MHRYLRIAFSVTCGILCLLLIVLWVRSYWWWDAVHYCPRPANRYQVMAGDGAFAFLSYGSNVNPLSIPRPLGWSSESWSPASRWNLGSDFDGESPRPSYWARAFPGFGRPTPGWLQVPMWFFVLVSGGLALAAAPWVRWRYSLRTLLVAMTLSAVGLGAVVYLSR